LEVVAKYSYETYEDEVESKKGSMWTACSEQTKLRCKHFPRHRAIPAPSCRSWKYRVLELQLLPKPDQRSIRSWWVWSRPRSIRAQHCSRIGIFKAGNKCQQQTNWKTHQNHRLQIVWTLKFYNGILQKLKF
jgi:hypothetical protein